MEKQSQLILYKSGDGNIKVDVLLQDETVWLTIDQMSELFGKSRSTINEHIINVYAQKELIEDASMRKIGISDFSTKPTNFYNLTRVRRIGRTNNFLSGLPLATLRLSDDRGCLQTLSSVSNEK